MRRGSSSAVLPVLLVLALLAPEWCGRARVEVRPPSTTLIAWPDRGSAPLHVRVETHNTTPDRRFITEWAWNFGDGHTTTGLPLEHVYAEPGTYRIRLRISDGTRLVGFAETEVEVLAGDSPPTSGRANEVATDRGVLPDRRPASINSNEFCHEASQITGAPSRPPTARIDVTRDSAVAPSLVRFDGSRSSADRGVVEWMWNLGDGSHASGETIEHRYARAGRYLVTLTVRDDSGQCATTMRKIDVDAPARSRKRVLFDDALGRGIEDWSWTRVHIEEQNVRSGRRALRVTPETWGALRVAFAPVKMAADERLSFWSHSDAPESLGLRALWDEGGEEVLGERVRLADWLLAGDAGARNGVWRRAVIPIAALADHSRAITGFAWQAGDEDSPPDFLLDDIELQPQAALQPLSGCATPEPIRDFVRRRDASLELEGRPFRAVGVNLYYLQDLLAGDVRDNAASSIFLVRETLEAAACLGATVVRTWAFNEQADHPSAIQIAPVVLREEALRALDLAVAEAKSAGLRVILTLANNWTHYGGLPRYADWAGVPRKEVLSSPTVRQWLSDYSGQLAARVNRYTGLRYGDEPAILAIELANELRCPGCEEDDDVVGFTRALVREMRHQWPNHLLADGGEGFDRRPELYPGLEHLQVMKGGDGTSFSRLAELPEIDLVSYHLYPHAWGMSEQDAELYIDRHEAVARAAGKVAYLGEFGLPATDGTRETTYEHWLDRVFGTNGGSLALVWQLGHEERPDNDGYALIPGRAPRTFGVLARQASFLERPGLAARD